MHDLQGTREGEVQQMLWPRSAELQGADHVAQGRVATMVLGLSGVRIKLLYPLPGYRREEGSNWVSFSRRWSPPKFYRQCSELTIDEEILCMVPYFCNLMKSSWKQQGEHFFVCLTCYLIRVREKTGFLWEGWRSETSATRTKFSEQESVQRLLLSEEHISVGLHIARVVKLVDFAELNYRSSSSCEQSKRTQGCLSLAIGMSTDGSDLWCCLWHRRAKKARYQWTYKL